MSDARAGPDDASAALRDAYERLRRYYEVPAILAVVVFMLWVRLQAMGNFVRGDKVYFAGNDAYYHFREVNYVVRHWPSTMPFDPWTYFPYGTSQGQFGTLFDQLVATAALVVGLGSPSEQLVAEVVLVAPTVFGSLVAIPTFFIARRLAGRRAGVMAALVLALLPGTFLQRGLVGFADHNIAEVLFQSAAVFAFMVAVAVAERDQPVYELVADRDWRALWRPLRYSLAAGVMLALYLLVWPPGLVLVGILGLFYVVAIPLHVWRGRSPEPLASTGVVSLGTVAVLQLLTLDTFGLSASVISPVHVLLTAGVAVGSGALAWLARVWETRDLPAPGYPAAVAASVVAGLLVLATATPDLFGFIRVNVLRTFAFGQTDTTLTIAEAQSVPFGSLGGFLFQQYGLLSLVALVGLLGLFYPIAISRHYRAERLFVVVWGVTITLMAFTQIRFNYYLAVVVAVLTGWVVERFLGVIELPSTPRDLEVYQVLSLVVLVVIVVAPLAPPLAAGADTCRQDGTGACHVVATGQLNGPGAVVTWTEGLDWMEANTPAEGQYGGAANDMDYYGTYQRTDDYAYPDGAYGVMSWWDYGHWITVEGERIPNANPFQQGPRPASAFLLADNETRANLILEALPSRPTSPPIYQLSTAELRATVDAQSTQQAGEDTRYVMIDDQMAAGKFGAIATWTGPGSQRYFGRQEFQVGNTQARLVAPNDRYHGTMLARLYFRDASGLSHYRLVHETEQTTSIVSVARETPSGFQSTNVINRRLSPDVFAIVQQRQDLHFYDVRQASTVKTYERVPGATLTGQVPTNNVTTVFATVQLKTNTGRNVTYVNTGRTDADGNFEMTVPYATTNTVGPAEGGTDTNVTARGDYQLFVGNPFQPAATGSTAVPEPAIYDGETITVTFQRIEQPSGNETDGSTDEATAPTSGAIVGPTDGGLSPSLDAPDSLGAASGVGSLAAAPRHPVDA